MIKIYDDKIENKEEIYKELSKLPFFYGERDNHTDPIPTGLTTGIHENSITYQSIHKFIKEDETLKDRELYRASVNLFIPREIARFHTDGQEGQLTLLYYANIENIDINEGGETKFLADNNTLHSVLPIPGRIVVFPANYLHSATPFLSKHRLTVAFRFKEIV